MSEVKYNPQMTLIEFTVCIGKRAKKLAKGEAPLVELPVEINGGKSFLLVDIAREEIRRKLVDMKILRKISDGSFIELDIRDLDCPLY